MNLPNPIDELHLKKIETPEVTSGLGQTERLGFSYAPRIQGIECEMSMSYPHYPPGLDSERTPANRPPYQERDCAVIHECPLTCHHQLHGITELRISRRAPIVTFIDACIGDCHELNVELGFISGLQREYSGPRIYPLLFIQTILLCFPGTLTPDNHRCILSNHRAWLSPDDGLWEDSCEEIKG